MVDRRAVLRVAVSFYYSMNIPPAWGQEAARDPKRASTAPVHGTHAVSNFVFRKWYTNRPPAAAVGP